MWYIGGKVRQGKRIADVINNKIRDGQTYIEPFCGALGSAMAVAKIVSPSKMILSDSNKSLINMWNGIFNNTFVPPENLDRDTYMRLKDIQDPNNPMTAYAGYSCSFGGKWFGGYVKSEKHYTSRNLLIKKTNELRKIKDLTILNLDYREYTDFCDCVFYLDPPYIGRTKQGKFKFDHTDFWDFARCLSDRNVVLISEFIAPVDFKVVISFGDTVVRHLNSKGADGTIESLYEKENQ